MTATDEQHWLTRAACTPEDAAEDVFDYDPHRPNSAARRARFEYAKTICQRCPVIDHCLLNALDLEKGTAAGYRFEIYGGLTPVERARLDPTVPTSRAPRPKVDPNRTHCPRNHELTKANTYVRPGRTTPECVTCANDNKRRSAERRAKRQAGAA